MFFFPLGPLCCNPYADGAGTFFSAPALALAEGNGVKGVAQGLQRGTGSAMQHLAKGSSGAAYSAASTISKALGKQPC